MIALLQRVSSASVEIENTEVAAIANGLLVLVGIEKNDSAQQVQRLVERLLNYRVFADAAGKMNLSLRQTEGGIILVPQFTLAADTSSGNRPGFSTAAEPELGRTLFKQLVETIKLSYPQAQCGKFGADMQVHLINDGPVTFSLQV